MPHTPILTPKQKESLRALLHDYRTLFGLWMLLPVIMWLSKMTRANNFLIYRGSFWNAVREWNLYLPNPAEYGDSHHYGPLFSLLFSPFAIFPLKPLNIGLLLWGITLTLFLYWAIRHSQFNKRQQLFILWFCAHEMLTALFMQQFNIAIAATILLAYYLIEREKDFWAAFFIMLGTFVKIYSIVGLAFFFFSKHKGRLIGGMLFWAVVFFLLPMPFFHGWDYIVEQYYNWYVSLAEKNALNAGSIMQNISLIGMTHRITGMQFNDLWLIIPGMVLFALPYLRFDQYKNMAFRQTLLASVLMFIILFSTGSESSGYITPFIGIVIWYTAAPWKRTRWDVFLLVFAFILSSMSPSDLFPAYLRREYVHPYALKALPVTIIWLQLCYEMLTKEYAQRAETTSCE
ncbi:MAG: DUF2029 domain-containing protein [Prevotella sp.]|nr:DUF2029 domain-containing protein [Prevotella sp.]